MIEIGKYIFRKRLCASLTIGCFAIVQQYMLILISLLECNFRFQIVLFVSAFCSQS